MVSPTAILSSDTPPKKTRAIFGFQGRCILALQEQQGVFFAGSTPPGMCTCTTIYTVFLLFFDPSNCLGTEPWPSALARMHGLVKGLAHRSDGGTQSIGAEQERRGARHRASPARSAAGSASYGYLWNYPAVPGIDQYRKGSREARAPPPFLEGSNSLTLYPTRK